MSRTKTPFLVLFLALVLAGCGGGGGGAPATPTTPVTPDPAPTEPSSRTVTDRDILLADPERLFDQAAVAANSTPRFGSVTQSTALNISGTTRNSANAEFDGQNVEFSVLRQDGSTINLSSLRNLASGDATPTPIPGHTAEFWFIGNLDADSVDGAFVAVSWDNNDPTDYLAGGYWVSIEGSLEPLVVTGAEVGVFVDGPELDMAPNLPVQGRASYRGASQGLFAFKEGLGNPLLAPNTEQVGQFYALADLDADFSNSSISGCLGCRGGAIIEGFSNNPDGTVTLFSGDRVDARLLLNNASFSSNGQFTGSTELIWTGRPSIISRGTWGGEFSGINNPSGNPRLVAGTAGAEWRGENGATARLLGPWYAVEE